MRLKNRMAGIEAYLDDLQAGLEACSRGADALHTEATKFDELLTEIPNAPSMGSLLRHSTHVRACTLDQRATLQELRDGIARLREDLKESLDA